MTEVAEDFTPPLVAFHEGCVQPLDYVQTPYGARLTCHKCGRKWTMTTRDTHWVEEKYNKPANYYREEARK